MKKLKRFVVILVLSMVMVFTFTGCNMSCTPGNYQFNRVHISVGGRELCKEICVWYNNEIGCEVTLTDGNSLYLSEGTYILIKGTCPICNNQD